VECAAAAAATSPEAAPPPLLKPSPPPPNRRCLWTLRFLASLRPRDFAPLVDMCEFFNLLSLSLSLSPSSAVKGKKGGQKSGASLAEKKSSFPQFLWLMQKQFLAVSNIQWFSLKKKSERKKDTRLFCVECGPHLKFSLNLSTELLFPFAFSAPSPLISL